MMKKLSARQFPGLAGVSGIYSISHSTVKIADSLGFGAVKFLFTSKLRERSVGE